MLSPDHCLRRAEMLRISMLMSRDRIEAARLRTLVIKYRTLADRAVKVIDSPPAVLASTKLPFAQREAAL